MQHAVAALLIARDLGMLTSALYRRLAAMPPPER